MPDNGCFLWDNASQIPSTTVNSLWEDYSMSPKFLLFQTHAPKHWSSEETMIQYVTNIIVPYVEHVRADIGDNKTALVIIDNFKG